MEYILVVDGVEIPMIDEGVILQFRKGDLVHINGRGEFYIEDIKYSFLERMAGDFVKYDATRIYLLPPGLI